MLRSVKELYGYSIKATDGLIGHVHDVFFDDQSWTVRYLVVDTRSFLPGGMVLISPDAFETPDWNSMTFPVKLTKVQVKESPDVDTEQPVSRQHEMALREYYGWPLYWSGFMTPAGTVAWAPTPSGIDEDRAKERSRAAVREEEQIEQSHLRSAKEISGYHIEASDGGIGHVDDFVADDESWQIRYLVIDTRNWLPGKHVVIAPDWVDAIDWNNRKVVVSLTKDGVKNSPEFDAAAPVNREYEEVLYDYYGRPKYWV